jgi:hypothetical protein
MPDLTTYNMAVEMGKKKDTIGAAMVTTATTGNLTNKANAINTTGKYVGKLVLNTTTNILVVASGTTDVSPWMNVGTGVAAHTPS